MECKSLSLSEILNDWCAKYAALIAFSSLIVSIMGFIIPMVQFFFQPASQSWFTHNNELIFRGAILAAVISFLFYTYYVYPEKFAQRFEGKLSNQILCEINKAVAPGFYRRSTIDQAAILELQAIKILIITDSLKFEKLVPPINSQKKSIMQVMKDEIERISREYYDTKTSTNQVKFKHWYLIPESKLELNKKIIEEEILSGIGIDKNLRYIFLRDHVKGIEDRYFEYIKTIPGENIY